MHIRSVAMVRVGRRERLHLEGQRGSYHMRMLKARAVEMKEGDQYGSLCTESAGLGDQLDPWGREGKEGICLAYFQPGSLGRHGGCAILQEGLYEELIWIIGQENLDLHCPIW